MIWREEEAYSAEGRKDNEREYYEGKWNEKAVRRDSVRRERG